MKGNTKMRNFAKIVIVAVIMVAIFFALKYASNFEMKEITDRTNLVVNYTNVTAKMKNKVYIEDDVIYLSKEDIKNYYDKYIYYDKAYNRIITSGGDKIAYISMDKESTSINDSKIIKAGAKKINDTIYIPISKLEEVYNIEITYLKEQNTIIIESLERESKVAKASKKTCVKYKPTYVSKRIDTLNSDEKVTIIQIDSNLD